MPQPTTDRDAIRNIVREELIAVKTEILAKSEDNVKTYAGILKDDIKEVADDKASSELAKRVVVQMDVDKLERKKRECNVVIKDIEEWTTHDKKLDTEADYNFVVESLGIEKEDIVSHFRAGKKSAGVTVKARPLVVKLKSKECVQRYTKDGRGSKVTSSSDFDKDGKALEYWINLDLCRADREAQYSFRKEKQKRIEEQQKR